MANKKTATSAWEAEGKRIQAELEQVDDELDLARVNSEWGTASQLQDVWNRLNEELKDHKKKRP